MIAQNYRREKDIKVAERIFLALSCMALGAILLGWWIVAWLCSLVLIFAYGIKVGLKRRY